MTKNTILSRRVRVVLLMIIVVALVGCTPIRKDSSSESVQKIIAMNMPQSIDELIETNPCGILRVSRPLINVSGSLTANASPNASLSLFVAPNTTFEAARFVVENCAPIGKRRLPDGQTFDLGHLPEGRYVVMLPRSSFDRVQGFPAVREINGSDLSVEMAFHGGDGRYSIAAFEITPRAQSGIELNKSN